MNIFSLGLIYLCLFFFCFVFTLRYKARLSKHDGDFPETLIKSFVLFIYLGGIFGLIFSLPSFMFKAEQVSQSIDYASLSASLTEATNNFINLMSSRQIYP